MQIVGKEKIWRVRRQPKEALETCRIESKPASSRQGNVDLGPTTDAGQEIARVVVQITETVNLIEVVGVEVCNGGAGRELQQRKVWMVDECRNDKIL